LYLFSRLSLCQEAHTTRDGKEGMVDSRPWHVWHGNLGSSASFLPCCFCCPFRL
jgi:hypothetical protein